MTEFTLNQGDVITLGDPDSPDAPILITVTDLTENQVRLGVTAPTEVQVHRLEVWDDIQENGRRR